MSSQSDYDASELNIKLLSAQFERAATARELAGMGITSASPADIESYIAMTPRQRRQANMAWLVLNASYTA